MLNNTTAPSSSHVFFSLENGVSNKRKRRPAGTPDPDAEVVSLSPKTLLESDRYVCDICNQGFQRDQNLQMHRRRHKVPWKLLKRENLEVKKRVFVCPEPSCLHHDPCHALGDLVGIKKHFRRKHSDQKQWVCDKCSKAYAVQSDFKAHLKTCGTRGHSCDCGRVFSRVESFIEHQDACIVSHARSELPAVQPACSSQTNSSTSPSSDSKFIRAPLPGLLLSTKPFDQSRPPPTDDQHYLELQLLPSSNILHSENNVEKQTTQLNLSIGALHSGLRDKSNDASFDEIQNAREAATGKLKMAMKEKAFAEIAREEAKKQIELAELEYADAKRIRQQAQVELEEARIFKEHATRKLRSTILHFTCNGCKQTFQANTDEASVFMSYISAATTEGEEE